MSSQISVVTYSAQCVRSLLSVVRHSLQTRQLQPSSSNPILLFALAPSPNTPPEVLADITSTLTQHCPEHVGCISAPLPYRYLDSSICSESDLCSLAYALVNGVSFRSTISGHAQAQVGRWHAAQQGRTNDDDGEMRVNIGDSEAKIINDLSESNGKVDWGHVWNCTANSATWSSSHGSGLNLETLPDGLRNLDPSSIDNILYFSDKAPEGLATVLEGAFPRANKLSLIASSTPFITGRPVTLFHNGSILSKGAVGIALDATPSLPPPVFELSFPRLFALSPDLNVTSSEGNLIITLDSVNPSQLLLSTIQKHRLVSSHTTWVGKEEEFYVGVVDPSTQQLSQLHRINAGDPSRGTIALDGTSAPRRGSTVRLYHLPGDPVPNAPRYLPDTTNYNSISLLVAPDMNLAASFGSDTEDGIAARTTACTVVPNTFLAASENGITVSRGAQKTWKCVVPGGRMGLSWNCLLTLH